MGLNANGLNRWLGGIALACAVGMLIAGETILKPRLHDVGFIIYWLACFCNLGAAVLFAFRDFRSLQVRLRQEQRSLLDATLKKIEADARNKPRQGQRGGQAGKTNASNGDYGR